MGSPRHQIKPSAAPADHAATVAQDYGEPPRVRERLVGSLNSASLPIAWVALVRDEPVGMVSLVWQRSPDNRVVPSLAELYVTPEFRRRGVGRQLCDHAIDCARAWRHPALYLYCVPTETYYAQHGWRPAWETVFRRNNREAIFLCQRL